MQETKDITNERREKQFAFNKESNRIGFGKGYYDDFLKNIKAYKIGICFKFQFMERIENNEYDVKMDAVISY